MPAFPHEIRDVNPEVNKKLLQDFTGERTGFLQVGPDKWFMPSKFRHEADKYYNMTIRPDDTWVVAFPRSGTTMVQEILWLLSNNLDYESAYRVPQMQRFPFLEFSTFIHEQAKVEFMSQNAMDPKKQAILGMVALPGYEVLGYVPSPRFIKTHLPFSLLPPNLLESGAKVVYIARNPKDVAVSCYHFKRLVQAFGYTGDFASYWDYFEKNQLPWAPYWAHINEGWKRRHQPNVLFLFYEDINKDLPGTVRKVAQFLNKSLSEEQVAQMSKHLNIENFRRNPAVNMDFLKEVGLLNSGEQSFIRKGSTSFKEADGKASLLPEFSREHRTAMEDIYSSLQEDLISLELVEEYLCRDTPTSEQPFAPSLSSTTLEEITVLLMDRSLRLTPQSLEETLEEIGEEKEEAKQQQPSKVPVRRAESDSSDGSAGDAMEGLWRMLSAYDEFRLTQPGYDAFDQDEPHWLDQDLMPWELVEESRKKCLEWFERNKRVDV